MASNQNTPQDQDNTHASKRTPIVLEATAPVKIADLVARNNNSTFIGKIVEVNVVSKVNKDDQTRRFLKGVVGDETGLVNFDLAEKEGVQFAVGNIVQFEKAMNKVSKEGHHYIEVKRFGKYTILSDHSDISVNSSVNKSEAVIPRLPEGEEPRHRQPRLNKRDNRQPNNNNNNNNNNGQTKSAPRSKPTGSNASKGPANNNNTNGNNNKNNRQNNRQNNSRNQPQQQQQNNNNRNTTALPPRPTNISQLQPGTTGQVVVGQVFELNTYNKTIRDHEATFFKGRLGDETGSINFDFKMRGSKKISNNDVIQFIDVMNKVDDNGYHYLTIGRFGFYNVVSNININTEESANKSSIEYIKLQNSN